MNAQQLSRQTQFIFNTYSVNPAVAGTKTYTPFYASYRHQWAGFKEAPVTYSLSGHTALPNRVGIGGKLFHDDTGGAISKTGMELTGSYHVDLNNQDAVSFGLSAVVGQYRFDNNKLNVYHEDDPALSQGVEKNINFDANFGLMVYGLNYFFGFAIPNLIQTNLGIEGVSETQNENARHFHFMGSYLYYFNDDFAIQPSALARFTASSPVQFDIYMKGVFQEMFWGALVYRHKDAVAVALGVETSQFALGYSYDLTTTDAANFSPHTHEITLGYYLARKGTYFNEKSLLGPKRLERSRVVR